MLTTLKAKLYPNAAQERALLKYLDIGREIFNSCLHDRREAWRESQTSRTRFDQNVMLTTARAKHEELRSVPVEVERDAIRRVDLAFQGFFRRAKAGVKRPGYPRFKGPNRYNSFTIGDCGNVLRVPGRVRVSGIEGSIRCRGLQPVKGQIKRLIIVRRAGDWFARVLVDDGQLPPPKVPATSVVGLDVGLNSFVTTTDGEHVGCPKHYRRHEEKLRRLGRHVSRCKRGSNRRAKAVHRLQRLHRKIDDCRSDFTHKLSKSFVSRYSFIAAEKLNIGGMARGNLSKSILDAAWGNFLWRVNYKAERAGVHFVQVDPKNTSLECSGCGSLVPKDLSVRVHSCPCCGLVLDRDINAARNILARGLAAHAHNSAPPSGSDGVMHAEGHKTSATPTRSR